MAMIFKELCFTCKRERVADGPMLYFALEGRTDCGVALLEKTCIKLQMQPEMKFG